jgi:hypothetical protein
MSQPLILKINLRNVRQDWCFKNERACYADIIAYENDQLDQYGNSHVLKQSPPKELRDKGEKAIIVGNAKWMPQRGGQQRQAPPQRQQPPAKQDEWTDDSDTDSQIPF